MIPSEILTLLTALSWPTYFSPNSSRIPKTLLTMTLIRFGEKPPNKTLKGHKLLVALPSFKPSEEEIDELQSRYSGLEVQLGSVKDVTKEEWKDVTILVTGYNREGLPDKDDVPNLEYVQLSSAGANLVVSDPLYKDTDIAFCTANGVHG